jgi:hypothetical protein
LLGARWIELEGASGSFHQAGVKLGKELVESLVGVLSLLLC